MESDIMNTKDTPYLRLSACDANIEPTVFVQGKWSSERGMIIRAPAASLSTCTSKDADWMETGRMYDYVVACKGLHSKIRNIEVVEDYDPEPHKLER